MIHILKLFFALCAVLFPLFVYAQEDTLNADGLFPKYNRPTYRMRESRMEDLEKLLSGEPVPPPADSDMIRGAFQRAARIMELDYKVNVLHGLWSWTIRFLPNT